MTSRTAQFRRMLREPRPLLLGGVYDGLSARLAERAGFDATWASGFCISASKALPDVGIVTMNEHLAATSEIHRATKIPVVADVDDGFGDVVNVVRMVREYEAAGVAAICMEDNRHPKRNSLYAELGRKLVSADEFAGKIRAAKDTQTDPDFVVIARTEAFVAGMGLDEALHRARTYAKAGADLILVHSKAPTPSEIKAFGEKWDGDRPLVCVPSKYPDIKAGELYDAGYRVIIFANQGMRASVKATEHAFRKMVEAQSPGAVEQEIASLAEIFPLVDFDEVLRIEAEFSASGAPGKDRKDGDG